MVKLPSAEKKCVRTIQIQCTSVAFKILQSAHKKIHSKLVQL